MLSRYCKHAIVLFDGDAAGITATLRATGYLYAAGIAARVATLPGAKDPDEFIIKNGAQALNNRLGVAMDSIEFQIETARKKYDLGITVQKVGFLKDAAGILKRLNTAIERDSYIRDIASKYAIDPAAMREHIGDGESELDFTLPLVSRRKAKYSGGDRQFDEAATHILYCMAQDATLCGKITSHLDAQEMTNPLYIKIFQAIVSARLDGLDISPSSMVTTMQSMYDSDAGEIFANVTEYEDIEARYTALSHHIMLVKKRYLQKQLDEIDTDKEFERFASVSTELKRLEGQKISL